jgi:hypothetical protein
MQPYTFAFIKILGIGAVAYFLTSLIPTTGLHYLDIGLRGCIIFIVYGVLIVAFNVSPEVNVIMGKVKASIGFKK